MQNEIEVKSNRRNNEQKTKDGITEWYFEFIKDYPKNRDEVLGYFDKAIQHFADKPNIREFFLKLKNQFLEMEKTL